MKKSEFLNQVQKELDHLKVNATSKELNKLNFEKFSFHHRTKCIYGQMTGGCSSKRATELYPKTLASKGIFGRGVSFTRQEIKKGTHMTPLEVYIYICASKSGANSQKHEEIIQYLKGGIKYIKL